MSHRATVKTPFGKVSIIWVVRDGTPSVCRIYLPSAEQMEPGLSHHPEGSCRMINEIMDSILAVVNGEEVTVDPSRLDLSVCTVFQRRVLLLERTIPFAKVSTYGAIGKGLGLISGARAVGNALARNPFPLLIPCHRTVRGDGSAGGFQGGSAMKLALLKLEGISFSSPGSIDLSRCFYGDFGGQAEC